MHVTSFQSGVREYQFFSPHSAVLSSLGSQDFFEKCVLYIFLLHFFEEDIQRVAEPMGVELCERVAEFFVGFVFH